MIHLITADIDSAIRTHNKSFNDLAEFWVRMGATGIALHFSSEIIYTWPQSLYTPPVLEYPVKIGTMNARLQLMGSPDIVVWQDRFKADADLLATILNQNMELEELTEELISSQDQMLTMYDSARTMRKILNQDDAIERISEEARRLINCEATAVILFNSDGPIMYQHPARFIMDRTLLQLVESMREFSGRIMLDETDLQDHGPDLQNMLFIPVQIEDKIGAVFGLINKSDGFSSPDIKLAEVLAISLGSKLEHISLYYMLLRQQKTQVEMSLAHQVQARLLPQKPPQIPGLDIYGAAKPAREVGGDFFDFMHRDQFPLTFTVGDVAGKGMSAALVMAMTRTAFRSAANLQFALLTPEDILNQINDELYEDYTDLEVFTTIFVGQYEAERSLLHYANAGHSPVIFCPARGEAKLLSADGPAIGVLQNCLSKDHSHILAQGDVLIIATDGFPEASNTDGEFYGYDTLLRNAEAARHGTAREIAEALYRAVEYFEDATVQHDDQTIIVIKRV